MRREAEHHHVEHRHHIAPVAVQQVAHLGGVFQQRRRHQGFRRREAGLHQLLELPLLRLHRHDEHEVEDREDDDHEEQAGERAGLAAAGGAGQEQDRLAVQPPSQVSQEQQRRPIAPVKVINGQQQRPLLRQPEDEPEQTVQRGERRPILAALQIAVVGRQHVRELVGEATRIATFGLERQRVVLVAGAVIDISDRGIRRKAARLVDVAPRLGARVDPADLQRR